MSTITTRPDQVEIYLMHLNAAMLDIPRADREDFIREIRTHIFEKLGQDGGDISSILNALGDPEELARQFHAECSMRVSSRSWSPWVLLRTAARWALTGVQGFAVFAVGVLGYVFGAAFYITAVLKPIFPNHIGLFIGIRGMQLANWPAPQGREVLGPYYTVVAFVIGFLIIAGTSLVLRTMMRKFASVRKRLA